MVGRTVRCSVLALSVWFVAAEASGQLYEGVLRHKELSSDILRTSDGTPLLVTVHRIERDPAYWLGISGSGLVEFRGGRGVMVEGLQRSHVPAEVVEELLQAIEAADFFSLEESYRCWHLHVRPIFVGVLRGESRKSVRICGRIGRSGGPGRDWGPPGAREVYRLEELYRTIERLVEIEKWVGTPEQRAKKARAKRQADEIARKASEREREAKIAELESQFDSGDVKQKREAAVSLLEFRTRVEDALPVVLKVLQSPDEGDRRKAASSIWSLVSTRSFLDLGPGVSREELVLALTAGLHDSSPGVRTDSARALGWLAPEASAAAADLGRLLGDEVSGVRSSALDALSRLGPNAGPAARGLANAYPEARLSCRDEILRLLGRIGPSYAEISVPVLVRALEDYDVSSRGQAVRSLAMLGEAARPVLEALDRIAKADPNEYIRNTARQAITEIGKE